MDKKTYSKVIGWMGSGLFALLALTGCIADPMDDELYIKQVVLIGASEEYQEQEVEYGTGGEFFVSVYCSGTKLPDGDVTVTLKEAHQVNIDNFNLKNVLEGEPKYKALPEEWYEVPSYTGVIKAGERYARIPIRIKADRIDTDEQYLIPLRIMESHPYPVNELADTVLLVKIKMINEYSGSYTTTGVEYPVNDDGTLDEGNSLSFHPSRTLTAIDENRIRFYHKSADEKTDNLDQNGIVLTVDKTTRKVTVGAWNQENRLSVSNGSGTFSDTQESYGVRTRTFNIEYDYIEGEKKKHIVLELRSKETLSN